MVRTGVTLIYWKISAIIQIYFLGQFCPLHFCSLPWVDSFIILVKVNFPGKLWPQKYITFQKVGRLRSTRERKCWSQLYSKRFFVACWWDWLGDPHSCCTRQSFLKALQKIFVLSLVQAVNPRFGQKMDFKIKSHVKTSCFPGSCLHVGLHRGNTTHRQQQCGRVTNRFPAFLTEAEEESL